MKTYGLRKTVLCKKRWHLLGPSLQLWNMSTFLDGNATTKGLFISSLGFLTLSSQLSLPFVCKENYNRSSLTDNNEEACWISNWHGSLVSLLAI